MWKEIKKMKNEIKMHQQDVKELDKRIPNIEMTIKIGNLLLAIYKNISNLGINAVDIARIPEIEIPTTKIENKVKSINKYQYLLIKEIKKQHEVLQEWFIELLQKV